MFKEGEMASALFNGNLIDGKIIAVAKDDRDNAAYRIEAPDAALGAPTRWFKASEVFRIKTGKDNEGLFEHYKKQTE